MPQNYSPEFKKKIVRLRLEEGRTISSITTEYNISKETLRRWCNEFKEECRTSPDTKTEYDNRKEMLKLKRENEELRKENLFLSILRKGNRLEAYRFMEQHNREFGVRWLLKRLDICPNAYYNYRKYRKAAYYAQKEAVKALVREICHTHNGVAGYRTMTVYLARRGCHYSVLTVHKYVNTEMGLYSLVRPKKPGCQRGKPHKIFENRLQREFRADRANQKWCTDFTYLFLKNGEVRYNCSIVGLYDRSVIASITDRQITSSLAIRTLKKALESQPQIKEELILHSDQGSPYTSKTFVEFCESAHVTQSMSKAGCPYDNAPMERYFNTLKNECVNLYDFQTEDTLYQAVEEFAYVTYNHIRPHSYNGYRTPYQVRSAS